MEVLSNSRNSERISCEREVLTLVISSNSLIVSSWEGLTKEKINKYEYIEDTETLWILVSYLKASYKSIDFEDEKVTWIIKILENAIQSRALFGYQVNSDFELIELDYYIYLCSMYHDKLKYNDAFYTVEKALSKKYKRL